ncbi:MAG TPA: D-alanyl-D-alanine carboxypeptidase/D-alanyl-D-alanine-endopeptidase [Solirubrobacteraceae bacterium]|nr:D-alanyl-D-alanine carboxypeptidase/D-alanyl-D-alanine-endopeptidase [Solirubrobacteraceae bacterium]
MIRIATLACLLLLLAPAAARAGGKAATARALGAQMAAAGASSGALAVDLDTRETIYRLRADTPRMPASVEKLYTSATALERFGPSGRLATTVYAETPPDAEGVVEGDLFLRGSGDPNLDVIDLGKLAQQVDDAGITAITGRVIGDEFAWDTRRGVPSSGFALTSDVGVLSALIANRGRTGKRAPYWQARPAKFSANGFAKQLRHLGIDIPASTRRGRTPDDAEPVAAWRSASMRSLVRQMNPPSDNFIAEMLIKAIAVADGELGTTSGGAAAIEETLGKEFDIQPTIVDGSGLSRSDRTSPRQVVTMLQALADEPSFERSLPVAGRTGTIYDRMRGTPAQDRCRAKTGTLRDVSALAGYCMTVSGERVAFAFLMNYVNVYGARLLQDRMAGALARYSG